MKPAIVALPLLFLAFAGCCGLSGPSEGEGAQGCGFFGPPPSITGVFPCGNEGSPIEVHAGAPAKYEWNASTCYSHFKFQLRNGTDWGVENSFEADVSGHVFSSTFPPEPGFYMWNVQGFDPSIPEPRTANYPPCYFKVV